MTKISSTAADAWGEALRPRATWLIEHAASQTSDPLFYTGAESPSPWSVESARARRFPSQDAAWDFIHTNLVESLVRVRRHF